ncbi:MAG TPA: tyrosine-type recombinase/integrase [Sphingobium sp.]|uniref:tyrosine-type recombinase/integrase n=1 Tax=Sphingobium sp. TaxID=1912891 RepID=UPI002ED44A7C
MAKTALALRNAAPPERLGEVVSEVTALAPERVIVDPSLVEAAARAWSANTIRAFLSDIRLWDTWCRLSRVPTGEADSRTVAAYVRALSGQDHDTAAARATEPRAAATIARYLVSIGWAYRMAGRDDPTAAPLVRLELKAARKVLGTKQRQARAIRFKGEGSDLDAPASGVSLGILLKATRRDLLGLRDRALLLTAYDTACRCSELAALQVTDIDGPDTDGAGVIEIGRSKTDQDGQGAQAYLSPVTMRAIAEWRSRAGIDRGPLFRRVETWFDGSIRSVGEDPLYPGSITLIYKRLIRQAFDKRMLGDMSETEVARWIRSVSSHSIRVGVAQDNFAAGESLPAIMQAYRWRDPKTVLRYGAKLAAKSGASARMAARFEGG